MTLSASQRQAARRRRLEREGYIQLQMFVPESERHRWLGLGREVLGGLTVEAVVVRNPVNGQLSTIPLSRL